MQVQSQMLAHRLLNLLATLSIILSICISFLWIRSYWIANEIWWRNSDHPPAIPMSHQFSYQTPFISRQAKIVSEFGGVWLEYRWNATPNVQPYWYFGESINVLQTHGRKVRRAIAYPFVIYELAPVHEWSFDRMRKFSIQYYDGSSSGQDACMIDLCVPYEVLAVLSAVPFLLRLPFFIQQYRQYLRGQFPYRCMECGYDLRDTPDRCPECGTPAI